jgi:tetratricopeptide (TPR) repeat protein
VSTWGVALFAVLAGCAYYNATWSAEQYAKGARKLEAQGRESEARSQWAQAAAKAEAVVVKHPRSRWADDALVLQAEGLARSGSCDEAESVIAQARAMAEDVALRERLDLADAQCALSAGRPVQAQAALTAALKSKDQSRRSRADYFAGVAAASRLDYGAAVEHLQRSRELAARPALAYALLSRPRRRRLTSSTRSRTIQFSKRRGRSAGAARGRGVPSWPPPPRPDAHACAYPV